MAVRPDPHLPHHTDILHNQWSPALMLEHHTDVLLFSIVGRKGQAVQVAARTEIFCLASLMTQCGACDIRPGRSLSPGTKQYE